MVNNLHLSFLRDKIRELDSALFFSMSRSVLKLPNCLVSAIDLDDIGDVWLMMPRPSQEVKEFEQKFPVRLDFYKKGKDFYVNILGNARLILEPGEIDEMSRQAGAIDLDKWVLVKVEITDAQYHGAAPTVKHSWFNNMVSQLSNWLLPEPAGHGQKSLAFH